MEKKRKHLMKPECTGCRACDPYSYKTEVDLYFLELMKNALESLREEAPEHFARGWLELCNNYIDSCTKK